MFRSNLLEWFLKLLKETRNVNDFVNHNVSIGKIVSFLLNVFYVLIKFTTMHPRRLVTLNVSREGQRYLIPLRHYARPLGSIYISCLKYVAYMGSVQLEQSTEVVLVHRVPCQKSWKPLLAVTKLVKMEKFPLCRKKESSKLLSWFSTRNTLHTISISADGSTWSAC